MDQTDQCVFSLEFTVDDGPTLILLVALPSHDLGFLG